jgi:hypothetical protein
VSGITVGKVEPVAQRTHPHAEATYRVVPFHDGAFAVEVTIPASHPATISPFATKADAEAWIAEHRRRVQSEDEPSRWFRRSGSGGAKRPGSE